MDATRPHEEIAEMLKTWTGWADFGLTGVVAALAAGEDEWVDALTMKIADKCGEPFTCARTAEGGLVCSAEHTVENLVSVVRAHIQSHNNLERMLEAVEANIGGQEQRTTRG